MCINSEAGVVFSLFLVFGDFYPRYSYKIVLIKKRVPVGFTCHLYVVQTSIWDVCLSSVYSVQERVWNITSIWNSSLLHYHVCYGCYHSYNNIVYISSIYRNITYNFHTVFYKNHRTPTWGWAIPIFEFHFHLRFFSPSSFHCRLSRQVM